MATYSNLSDFIYQGRQNTISYQNLSYVQPFEDIKFPIFNVVTYDYLQEFKDAAVTINLTNDEFDKYKYKPRLLSIDLYGTTELFFVILAVNGMASEKEFSKQTIKLIPVSTLKDMMQQVYANEKQHIRSYNSRLMNEYIAQLNIDNNTEVTTEDSSRV